MRRWLLPCAVLALSVAQAGGSGPVSSCSGAPQVDIAGIQKQLTAAEALWRERGPAAYWMTVELDAESGVYSFQLSVPREDSGWVFVYPQSSPGRPGAQGGVLAPAGAETYTVTNLFAAAHSALRKARAAGDCGILELAFDPHDGHVRFLRSDDFAVVDDEFTLTVSPLRPLP